MELRVCARRKTWASQTAYFSIGSPMPCWAASRVPRCTLKSAASYFEADLYDNIGQHVLG